MAAVNINVYTTWLFIAAMANLFSASLNFPMNGGKGINLSDISKGR